MRFLLSFLLMVFCVDVFPQAYMEQIVKEACECLNEVPDTLPKDEMNMKLGLCMIRAAQPHEKQLKKEHGISFAKMDRDGEKLGRIIGVKMALKCPDVLLKLTEQIEGDDVNESVATFSTEGTITKIDVGQFITFMIKDGDGKSYKYLWLSPVESSLDMANDYQTFTGKKVWVEYGEKTLFDPRINEYRSFRMIASLEEVAE